MTTITNPKALYPVFAPLGLTHVPEVARPIPTEGPFDWTVDCFVFRAEMSEAPLT